jgi:16S rRNA (guanine966-N2)-methyltransferase
MRVIAGRLGGRRLQAPKGTVTRPTSDRVREALFAMLGDVEGASVLDLFAGTGALGIEALSRGAQRAVFVERDPRVARVLGANLDALGIPDEEGEVRRVDAFAGLRSAQVSKETYDLRPHARVIVESDRRAPLELELPIERDRRYGDTSITIHCHQ